MGPWEEKNNVFGMHLFLGFHVKFQRVYTKFLEDPSNRGHQLGSEFYFGRYSDRITTVDGSEILHQLIDRLFKGILATPPKLPPKK